MNADSITNRIQEFITVHHSTLEKVPDLATQVLELAAAVAAGNHYESFGYTVAFVNPSRVKEFVVKSSSRGYPWNFSRIAVSRNERKFEIHMNLMVRSARDPGVYCVDLAVTRAGIVPRAKTEWACLPNDDLITFAEAKKLVVYPMLLAHFIGIVHEITPAFLQGTPPLFDADNHFAPALITLGHFTMNAREIVAHYRTRGICVNIEANFNERFADNTTRFRFGLPDPVLSAMPLASHTPETVAV